MGVRPVIVGILALGGVAACVSESGVGVVGSSVAGVSSTVVASSRSVGSSTVVAPSVSTTGVASSTVVATSTSLPVTSTTVDLFSLLIDPASVVDAAELADRVFIECAEQLPDCDLSVLETRHTGPQLSQGVAQLSELASEGVRFRNTEARVHVVLSAEVLGVEEGRVDALTAETTECTFDASVGFRVLPDGSEEIVGDGSSTRVVERVYVVEDGVWKRRDSETVPGGETIGENRCES